MKTAILGSVMILAATGMALAGPGSGKPRSPADPDSGRPAAVLDESQCSEVWSKAKADGALSKGTAAPYIVSFDLIDADSDGEITQTEFEDGCKRGLVQQTASAQQPSGQTVPMAPPGEQELPASQQ